MIDGTKLKGEDLVWNSEKGKEIPLKCEGGLLGQWEKELDGNGFFLFSGHEPIYFIENKEKTLRASYDRGTQIFEYMD